jgi:hypothetical protein
MSTDCDLVLQTQVLRNELQATKLASGCVK